MGEVISMLTSAVRSGREGGMPARPGPRGRAEQDRARNSAQHGGESVHHGLAARRVEGTDCSLRGHLLQQGAHDLRRGEAVDARVVIEHDAVLQHGHGDGLHVLEARVEPSFQQRPRPRRRREAERRAGTGPELDAARRLRLSGVGRVHEARDVVDHDLPAKKSAPPARTGATVRRASSTGTTSGSTPIWRCRTMRSSTATVLRCTSSLNRKRSSCASGSG